MALWHHWSPLWWLQLTLARPGKIQAGSLNSSLVRSSVVSSQFIFWIKVETSFPFWPKSLVVSAYFQPPLLHASHQDFCRVAMLPLQLWCQSSSSPDVQMLWQALGSKRLGTASRPRKEPAFDARNHTTNCGLSQLDNIGSSFLTSLCTQACFTLWSQSSPLLYCVCKCPSHAIDSLIFISLSRKQGVLMSCWLQNNTKNIQTHCSYCNKKTLTTAWGHSTPHRPHVLLQSSIWLSPAAPDARWKHLKTTTTTTSVGQSDSTHPSVGSFGRNQNTQSLSHYERKQWCLFLFQPQNLKHSPHMLMQNSKRHFKPFIQHVIHIFCRHPKENAIVCWLKTSVAQAGQQHLTLKGLGNNFSVLAAWPVELSLCKGQNVKEMYRKPAFLHLCLFLFLPKRDMHSPTSKMSGVSLATSSALLPLSCQLSCCLHWSQTSWNQ